MFDLEQFCVYEISNKLDLKLRFGCISSVLLEIRFDLKQASF